MKLVQWLLCLAVAPCLAAQDLGDGCGSALDSLNRLKETFYANAERLDFKLAYSNLVTATRNCPDSGELWYFRGVLGPKGGATKGDTEYSLRKAESLGWRSHHLATSNSTEAALPPHIGTKWALVVGVGKFSDNKLRPLKFPAADAASLRDLLIDPDVGRFPAANVKLLKDEEAGVSSIREGIGWLRANAKTNDLVLVYFASHGLPREQDPNGVSYIAAYDSSLANAATRYSTSIQMIDLVQDLTRELQSLRVILILDTCYSGDAATPEGQSAIAKLSVSQMASFSDALRMFQSGAGRIVMTAASADQRSYESDQLGHGYFTHFLLTALKETRGRASVGELFRRVRPATENAVRAELGKVQTPMLIAGSAAAEISLGVEPGHDKTAVSQ